MIPFVDLKAQYQTIRTEVNHAIQRVLDNTSFIMGDEVVAFETAFAEVTGAPHAIGVASGTTAIHLILDALGVGRGDEVITTPHTFIATAEAIRHAGATPVFVDIDPQTYNIDPTKIESAITERTKAIMPVHLYGQAADLSSIVAIAKKHNLFVIEDAAQAHLAQYDGQHVGLLGDAGTFSFYPGKNLGAYGDAGAVITHRDDIAEKVRMLRNHGRREKYVHETHGYGERLDGLQAAILGVKLAYLAEWTTARQEIAQRYRDGLAGLPLLLPKEVSAEGHVYHLFVIKTDRRDALKAFLKEKDISSGVHYPLPLHLQPALSYLGHQAGDFPVCEDAAKTVLSLPVYPELRVEQQQHIIHSVGAFFDG